MPSQKWVIHPHRRYYFLGVSLSLQQLQIFKSMPQSHCGLIWTKLGLSLLLNAVTDRVLITGIGTQCWYQDS